MSVGRHLGDRIAHMSDVGPWNRILLRHVRDAFIDDASIARQWRALNFTDAPDFGKALDQYGRFVEALSCSGAQVLTCSGAGQGAQLGLDSIYVRDASV